MTNPTLISTPFATAGGKNTIQESVPLDPNSPTWEVGFPAITSTPVSEGGLPPKRLDFNGVLNAVTENTVHLTKGLGYEFDATYATKIGGYPIHAVLTLTNGDRVQSTVANNIIDPNVDMTWWKPTNGSNTVDSISDLIAIQNPKDGQVIFVKNIGNYEYTGSEWVDVDLNIGVYADKYASLELAISSTTSDNNINLAGKGYSGAIDVGKKNLIGVGYATVINVSENSYGIKSLQTTPNWDRMRLTDMAFKGQSRVGSVGFTFDENDAFSGRRNIEYCTFDNLDIGIHKPTGNIGNTYRDVSFSNSNYGYRAKSSETPLMHAGNDRFVDAQFNSIDKWAIDLENTSGSDGFGQFTVDNSIFQFSSGGGIRINMGGVVPICPPVIRSTWFEEIAPPNTTINRDGVLEAPREIKLIDCPIVFVEGCYLKNIELINSTMITKGCRIDSATTAYNIIVKDAKSQIFADDVYLDGTISTNVIVRSVAKQKRIAAGGDLTFLSTQIRSVVKNPSNSSDRIGLSFRDGVVGTTTWAINGSVGMTATCVSDGGEPVARLDVQNGVTNVIGNFGVHAEMWVVWGFSVKPLTAMSGTFSFKYDLNFGAITMKQGEWTHNTGIAKAATTGYISGWLEPSANGSLLMRDYFVAEFSKEEDALNFVNSRMSIKETS